MTKVDEQTVERVAKSMWEVVNRGVEMSWASAVRFERMAQAAIATMQYTKAEERNDALREAAMIADEWYMNVGKGTPSGEILSLIDKENTL